MTLFGSFSLNPLPSSLCAQKPRPGRLVLYCTVLTHELQVASLIGLCLGLGGYSSAVLYIATTVG